MLDGRERQASPTARQSARKTQFLLLRALNQIVRDPATNQLVAQFLR